MTILMGHLGVLLVGVSHFWGWAMTHPDVMSFLG